MLKEYLNRKIDENEEKIRGLKSDIIQIQHRVEEDEKLAAVLKEETSTNAEIFSPRNHRLQNKEKLSKVLDEITKNREALEHKNKLLEDLVLKQKEYNEMLKEAQKSAERTVDDHTDIPQINSIELKESESGNVSRETISVNQEDIEKERALAGNRIAEGLKQLQKTQNIGFPITSQSEEIKESDYKGQKKQKEQKEQKEQLNSSLNMEIKSGELIILESERKKEREFLEDVYIRIERSLAMLNGNRNVCKKELQQIKKMIYDYVKSIS